MTRPFVGTLLPEDYAEITNGVQAARSTAALFFENRIRADVQHQHRYWEYGSAVEALLSVFNSRLGDIEVLDVGSGCGVMGPSLVMNYGTKVTECEPDLGCTSARKVMNDFLTNLGKRTVETLSLGFGSLPDREYDAVTCISVIEHVPDEKQAWKELAARVKKNGVFFMTTDCVPVRGKQYFFDDLRTHNYDLVELKERVESLQDMGFTPMGEPDWHFNGPKVYDYTFFRCGMIRN